MCNTPAFRSETEFLAWVERRTRRRAAGLRLGVGDDAALVEVPPGHELVLTTDMSIEGVHFTAGLHPPQAVGHRALARSLSDIAAMGGMPRYALISLALSKHASRTWLEEFFDGFLALARRFGVTVIGGDTALVRAPTLIDVVVAGEVPCGQALRRSSARPRDLIYVSGCLGLAALGLRILQSASRRRTFPRGNSYFHPGGHGRASGEAAAFEAHLYPQPQCALGRFLSEQGLATALMDLSDGLSIDLKRLCDASHVGARVFAERIPIPSPGKQGRTAGAKKPAGGSGALPLTGAADALALALHGGEDYQLLFTVPPARQAEVPARFGKIPLRCIGEIQAARRIQLISPGGRPQPLEPHGYDHFARQ
jgi:thiamine-monophosphate kinase